MDGRILVIKLGALGDVIQATAAMKAIRRAHPSARIDLLTTPAFAEFLAAAPYFDHIDSDGRPRSPLKTLAMLARLRRAHYDRVYDLQTSSRSSWYFQALRPGAPAWSGIARGAALRQTTPGRGQMHTLPRLAEQLRCAGLEIDESAFAPDLGWAAAKGASEAAGAVDEVLHGGPFALIVPGGSAHRPAKRWPAAHYGEAARRLAVLGLKPVVVGGPSETPLADTICAAEPMAADLTGRTDLFALAALGAAARLCLGNDTGPTHIAAAAGAPSVVLFSDESDPARCAPLDPGRPERIRVLREPDLGDMPPTRVLDAVTALLHEERADSS